MNLDDVERFVVEMYLRHRLDPRQPETPWKLARLELGEDCFYRPPRLIGGSQAFELRGEWKIAMVKNIPEAYAAHTCGHELGHAVLGRAGIKLPRPVEERVCDQIGGAILAPSPAMVALFDAHRFDLRAIAREAVCTPTWAALRIGEALGIPCAVVSPERVRLRRLASTPKAGLRKALGGGRTAVFQVA